MDLDKDNVRSENISMPHRFVRDSFWGRLAYDLSRHKVCTYKEDDPDYVVPQKYYIGADLEAVEVPPETSLANMPETSLTDMPEASATRTSSTLTVEGPPDKPEYPITPTSTYEAAAINQIIVDWDGPDDPENPYNWPLFWKVFFVLEISFLTISVYMASAIYAPSTKEIQSEWSVGRIKATLPLSLFVIGYGIGPMVFSPMSENVLFGRTSIYVVTLLIFFLLQIPTALAPNIASLCVLRFLAGFYASPAVATGGASIGDVILPAYIPVGFAVWFLAAVCGQSMGPLLGSIFAQFVGWRWVFWFMLIFSGCSFLILGFLLPETHRDTLLHRKALRLRARTGNKNITSTGEIVNQNMNFAKLALVTLWRPFELTIFEPVVLLINIYIALVYSIMYLWFEAFSIALGAYKFNLTQTGVAYVSIISGVIVGAAIYIPVVYEKFTKRMLKGHKFAPEVFLPLGIFGAACMPVGLFIFGWAALPGTHWIGPLIGTAVFAIGGFLIFQTLFNYLSMSFQKYMASAFASNGLLKTLCAGALPLVAEPFYTNLGSKKFPVGWGSSLLGFICVAVVGIPVFFYLKGDKLRAQSKYAII